MCTFRASCFSMFVVGANSDMGQPFRPRQNYGKLNKTIIIRFG